MICGIKWNHIWHKVKHSMYVGCYWSCFKKSWKPYIRILDWSEVREFVVRKKMLSGKM